MENFRDREGIPVEQQRMLYTGKLMEEERTLSVYSIYEGATIHLLLRLPTDNENEPAEERFQERIDQTRRK